MNQFEFNSNNNLSCSGISNSLKLLYNTPYPVIVCVGSDLAVGDSLGPIIGSELKYALKGKSYVYGSLESPITAKEIKTVFNTSSIISSSTCGNSDLMSSITLFLQRLSIRSLQPISCKYSNIILVL